MKNFPVIDKNTNKEYWISRSIAAVICVIAKDKSDNKYVLAVQRGNGTPDPEFIGTWCLPCGYLDYDETTVQAARRELIEETGLQFPISDFKLVSINDNPQSDKRQNVTFRYKIDTINKVEDLRKLLTSKNSEKDEVSQISFIPIENINNYLWAFNHNSLIKEICLKD